MSSLKPTKASEKEAWEKGKKHYADRNPHRIGNMPIPANEIPPYNNPYTPQTMEYMFFNRAYLETK